MIVLQVNNITKYFGAELILSNIKLEVQSKDRIALVGRNGAGKSTLLKIISGEISYDSGELIKPNDLTIGYLEQHTGLESQLTIWEEMLTVFQHFKNMEKTIKDLEMKMGDPAFLNHEEKYEKLLKDYDDIQQKFKDMGGYQYEADIRSVLHGLNFADYPADTLVSTLSGGQKTRLALGKLLLTKPDLLILDEPTNHLDIDTLAWLEQYLQGYPGALLIVSHDRYFLDKVVSIVYEISRNHSSKFHGNYSDFLDQKAEQYERDLKLFEKQQGQIDQMKDFIQKNIARASTTKRAQSRRKQLEKMTVMDRPKGDEKSASFQFDIERISGNDVISLENLSGGYSGSEIVFKKANMKITRGESIALVGPNGVGKSTLLKTLIDELPIIEGTINYGSNVKIGYYDQEQAKLVSNKRLLNELWDEYPNVPEREIRSVLGNFLFSGDDVLKNVSDLSGGEKARLALSKLMMQKANFLILDEPTNHLDLDSKEVLESALLDYPGTILFVSHDRYFINRIATRVVELSRNGLTSYLGDYDYYINKKEELREIEALEKKEKETIASDQSSEDSTKTRFELDKDAKRKERQRQRRIQEIEDEITKLEELITKNEDLLCDPEVFQDFEKSGELNDEIEQCNETLEKLLEEWELLQNE